MTYSNRFCHAVMDSVVDTYITKSPKGDNHHVIVLPGFCSGPPHTAFLRKTLSNAGYQVHDWGQGFNWGPGEIQEHALLALVDRLYQNHGKISLVGWSLGGLYARTIANIVPEKIRKVITMGSPHRTNADEHWLKPVFDLVSPKKLNDLSVAELERSRKDPPVPLVSIFSKRDEVVDWKDCLCDESSIAKNVESYGSHVGMGFNPGVVRTILDELPV